MCRPRQDRDRQVAVRAPGDSQPTKSAPGGLKKIPATTTSPSASTLMVMSLTVHLPDELAERLADEAAARHQSPEQVALEAIEAALPLRRRLSFSGIGASASPAAALRQTS